MEKRYLDEISNGEKEELRNILENMKALHEQLRETLFIIDDEGDVIEEKLHGANELKSTFGLWVKGESLDIIGEVVYQDDTDLVEKIFEAIGMTDIE